MSLTLSASLPTGLPTRLTNGQIRPKIPARSKLKSTQRAHTADTIASTVECLATPCPKCHKRTIVQRSLNTFDCLNCSFHKQLPPVSASSRRLIGSRGLMGDRSTGLEGINAEGGGLGQGSLSRLIDAPTPSYRQPWQEPSAEPDTAQPLIFAAIAVIIGILIL